MTKNNGIRADRDDTEELYVGVTMLDTALFTGEIRLAPTTITNKVSNSLVIVCIFYLITKTSS